MEKIEFMPPKGLRMPEPGQEVSMPAKVMVKPDGVMCITELDGVSMPGYGKTGEVIEEEGESSEEMEGKLAKMAEKSDEEENMKGII